MPQGQGAGVRPLATPLRRLRKAEGGGDDPVTAVVGRCANVGCCLENAAAARPAATRVPLQRATEVIVGGRRRDQTTGEPLRAGALLLEPSLASD